MENGDLSWWRREEVMRLEGGGWRVERVMEVELVELVVVLEGWGLIWLRVLHLKLLGISEGMGDVTDWFG